ncbi:hypothetical protein ACTA71_005078 [Dictyostelium dimigraforme]
MGAYRYFHEFSQLNLFNIDFDQISINNGDQPQKTIQLLLDSNQFIQKEYIIRNNQDQLYAKLSPNLEYILNSKKPLNDEIEVKATGINYKKVTHGAKTMGAINLHGQSIKRNWNLKQFILSSSVSSMIGSTDQCTYVCSNRVLDSLSRYRKSIGLTSICTNYVSVQSAGLVSRNKSIEQLLDGRGLASLSINMILGTLDLQIQNIIKSTNLMVSPINFNNFFETYKNYAINLNVTTAINSKSNNSIRQQNQ